MKVPKFRHSSSSAEAAAAADDVSIVNAFVTVLFTLECVEFSFCRLVNLKVLSQAKLHGRSLQVPRSTVPPDTPTQYLVLGGFLYFICRSSLLIDRN